MSTDNQNNVQDSIAALSLKLPPFFSSDPNLWFIQAESQFVIRKITQSVTKYHYVIQALTTDALNEVRDIISDPDILLSDDPFLKLKKALVDRLQITEAKRVQQVLSEAELGDKKPTQFLRHMQALLGDKAYTFDQSVFKQLFLNHLPPSVRQVLAAFPDENLQKIAEIADKVMETIVPTVQNVHIDNTTSTLQQTINALTTKVEDLSLQINQMKENQRARSRSRPRNNANTDGVCYYHSRFGNRATKCTKPSHSQRV